MPVPKPFFESEEPAAPGAPRLLVISYNFPPDPSVGGIRWQEMSRYFVSQGWAVDVIGRDFAKAPGIDLPRLSRISKGVRVFSVPDREPLLARLVRAVWPTVRKIVGQRRVNTSDTLTQEEVYQQTGPRSLVRAYHVSVEVARDSMWAKIACELGIALAAEHTYEAIVSSGPPHMAHDAGRMLSMNTGIPHVVDMRDPWSFVQRLYEPIANLRWVNRSRAHEVKAVEHAAFIVMNTRPARDAMRAAYPVHASRIHVIRNGADDHPLPVAPRDDCFRLRFAGSIYWDRDPRIVFRAARLVITELNLRPDRFSIELVGSANQYAGVPTTQLAEEEDVAEYVRIGGRLHHEQAMEFLAGAAMLLSLPQDSDFAIPAKIYEYVRFPAWMLVLATPDSATAQLLRGSSAHVIDPSDLMGVAHVIRTRFKDFKRGLRAVPAGADGRFDRRHESAKFLELLTTWRQQHAPRTS